MEIRSNDIVEVTKDGNYIGAGHVIEVDYFRSESERYIVRLKPASEDDFSKNIYASESELTFIEKPRH